MLIDKNTPDFNKQADVVSCFVIDSAHKALFLQRQPHKTSSSKWGPPAGKVELSETLGSAMARELKEETGLSITEDKLIYLGSIAVRHGNFDFEYHIFTTHLDSPVDIVLNPEEHQASVWSTWKKSFELDLVEDQATIHEMFWRDTLPTKQPLAPKYIHRPHLDQPA